MADTFDLAGKAMSATTATAVLFTEVKDGVGASASHVATMLARQPGVPPGAKTTRRIQYRAFCMYACKNSRSSDTNKQLLNSQYRSQTVLDTHPESRFQKSATMNALVSCDEIISPPDPTHLHCRCDSNFYNCYYGCDPHTWPGSRHSEEPGVPVRCDHPSKDRNRC